MSQAIRRSGDVRGHTLLCTVLGTMVTTQSRLITQVMGSHGFDHGIREELAQSVQRLAWAHVHAHHECQR